MHTVKRERRGPGGAPPAWGPVPSGSAGCLRSSVDPTSPRVAPNRPCSTDQLHSGVGVYSVLTSWSWLMIRLTITTSSTRPKTTPNAIAAITFGRLPSSEVASVILTMPRIADHLLLVRFPL